MIYLNSLLSDIMFFINIKIYTLYIYMCKSIVIFVLTHNVHWFNKTFKVKLILGILHLY